MIAIIPARKGSKGIKNKNIKIFHNKPLISHTIELALNSKLIKEIIISSDDNKVLSIAKSYNIKNIIKRPRQLAQDNSLAIDAYFHAINYLKINNILSKEIIILQPTSPLRILQDINSAYRIYKNEKADAVISCSYGKYPIEWSLKLGKNGRIQKYNSNKKMSNRQTQQKTLYPNGAIYILNIDSLLKNKSYYGKRTYPYIMPKDRSIDIDDMEDFKIAHKIFN
jgi:CMP-N,N'-diacetyllegionaminic acid synthase